MSEISRLTYSSVNSNVAPAAADPTSGPVALTDQSAPRRSPEQFLEFLEQFLAQQHPGVSDFRLASVNRRAEGWSWETYIVEAEWTANDRLAESYVVKREPVAGVVGPYNARREYNLQRFVRDQIGCPAPQTLWCKDAEGNEPGFFVMERVRGEVPVPWNASPLPRDDADRAKIGNQVAEAMVVLHGYGDVPEELGITGRGRSGPDTGLAAVTIWRQKYESVVKVRVPIIELALGWLEARADRVSGRVGLIHGDLRIGNFAIEGTKLTSIFDWETACFSDPVADLAQFALPMYRGKSPLASQVISIDGLLDAYATHAGWRPTKDTLNYWTTQCLVHSVIGSMKAAAQFESGATTDIRYANMSYQSIHSVRWLIDTYNAGDWGD